MRILHVIAGMQKAAGTSVFCGEVCNGLVGMGHDVFIGVPNPNISDFYQIDPRVRIIAASSILNSSPDNLYSKALKYDVIHIHALWSPFLHKVSKWASKNQIPTVWSPHGMLTPWAMRNKWWKKYPAWWLYQRRDLAKANLLHVTAGSEEEDVRRLGLKNPVVVVPLGVAIDCRVERVERADGKKILLFVSRVQRKKGLLNLVRAWAKLKYDYSAQSIYPSLLNEWVVRIVGPDQDNHTAELKLLCNELGVEKDFEFVGPVYGEDLLREYAAADIFVLPTYSENFGSVVIEALSHAVPVICTKGAPWKELETHKCGWWIDIGVEPLSAALNKSLSLSDIERREMGKRGRRLVEDKYTWDAVVNNIVDGYKEILNDRS